MYPHDKAPPNHTHVGDIDILFVIVTLLEFFFFYEYALVDTHLLLHAILSIRCPGILFEWGFLAFMTPACFCTRLCPSSVRGWWGIPGLQRRLSLEIRSFGLRIKGPDVVVDPRAGVTEGAQRLPDHLLVFVPGLLLRFFRGSHAVIRLFFFASKCSTVNRVPVLRTKGQFALECTKRPQKLLPMLLVIQFFFCDSIFDH
jgi:hypothetical protein